MEGEFYMDDSDLSEFRAVSMSLREMLWLDPLCKVKFSLIFLCDMLLVDRTIEEALDLGNDICEGDEASHVAFRRLCKSAVPHYKPDGDDNRFGEQFDE
tara:strand:+ start:869 stop:1165 length:297 start_codon:yes stop_codon:yes gene_type:complete